MKSAEFWNKCNIRFDGICWIIKIAFNASLVTMPKVNQSNNDALDINFLPNEIILKILSHLTQNQLGQIACVCRRWNALTRSPVLWKTVNVKYNNCPTTVAKYFINTLPSCVTCIRLDFGFCYWWTEPLNFMELSVKVQERCPHLKVLILNKAKLSDSLPTVIDICTVFLQNIKRLVFHCSRFPNCPAGKECDGISKIELLDLSGSLLGHFNNPPFSKMTRLKELRLSKTFLSDFWFEDDSSFLNKLHVLDLGDTHIGPRTFHVIQNQGFNVKELYLCQINLKDEDLTFNHSVFPYLETICLRGCDVTSEGVFSFIQSCPSLQNVYVRQDVAQSYAKHFSLDVNRCKIDIVKVIKCINHDKNYLCE